MQNDEHVEFGPEYSLIPVSPGWSPTFTPSKKSIVVHVYGQAFETELVGDGLSP